MDHLFGRVKDTNQTQASSLTLLSVPRGGYSRPSLRQVLWVQLVLLPVTLGHLVWWQARWLFKFTLGGQELGPVEKEYLIRRHMGLSQGQWDALEDRERQGFLRDQLWLKDKFKVSRSGTLARVRAAWAEFQGKVQPGLPISRPRPDFADRRCGRQFWR